MITAEKIELLCSGNETFNRGQIIYKVKNVKQLSVFETTEFYKYQIKGFVKGTNIEDYEVDAVVDEREEMITNISCNCMAEQGYDGLCKHCVAVLLEYMDRRDGKAVQGMPEMRRFTDIGFSRVLDRFAKIKNAEYMQPEWLGRVRLVPELNGENFDLDVNFRIGADDLYVIKNMHDFVAEVKERTFVHYGKNLEFYNMQSAYTEESQDMLGFILGRDGSEFGIKRRPYEKNVPQTAMKGMTLTEKNMDEFMALLLDKEIEFVYNRLRKEMVTVREGLPHSLVRIEEDKEGIMVYKTKQRLWYGRRYAYMLDDNVIYRADRSLCESMEEFIRSGDKRAQEGIFVTKTDLTIFVRDMLPDIRKIYQVDATDFNEAFYAPKAGKYKIYLDAPEPGLIKCKVTVTYGSQDEINIFWPGQSELNRNLAGERMVAHKVAMMFDTFDPATYLQIATDDEKIYLLLTERIRELQTIGEVFVTDAVKGIKIRSTPPMRLGISVTDEFLEMQVEGEELSAEELAEVLSRYDRKKKFYRLKDGDFLHLGEDEEITQFAMMAKAMQVEPTAVARKNIRIPKYRALYLEEKVKKFSTIEHEFDTGFHKLLASIRNISDERVEVPMEMKGILRAYQEEGFQWLMKLKKNGFGAILADEMGLGKTLQAITVLLACHKNKPKNPSLIVCPASLVYNWDAEISRFAPQLRTVMITGSCKEREELIKSLAPGDIAITSYDLLRRDLVSYMAYDYECEIIDEAQYIKNHRAQMTLAVKEIDANFKVALTGTPVENRLSELWSIFDYIMPGFLYTYKRFREEIEAPIVQLEDREALETLQKMIAPFVLRRLKKDVLKFLPEKIEKKMYAPMEGEQKELYWAHVQRMRQMLIGQNEDEFRRGKFQVLAELTRLRQLCCNPALIYEDYKGGSAKTQMCVELIKDAIEGGHRILLFSQFTSMLEMLQEELDKEHIDYLALTGSTTKERRAILVEEFNQGTVPVFCISLKAGGTGLNLTAADIVIHYDPWWNSAVENQATDRAHRIGQEKVVTVYKLIAKESIEEGIVELQEKKRELADEILSSDSISTSDISREQLLELLG